jgi:deoxyadenosine/deoxycytidine kinase
MKRLSIIILFFVLVTNCGHKDKGFMPERLLNEQEMIDIMTDVQIIEADINFQKSKERERDPNDTTVIAPKDYVKISREYYDQLFEHYHITDSIFVQNMRYYTLQPATLEKIMDSVMNRLAKEQSEP